MTIPYQLPPPPSPPPEGLLQRILKRWLPWFQPASGSRVGGQQGAQNGQQQNTQTGSAVESPTLFASQLVQLQYDRESVVTDVRDLVNSEPRIAQDAAEVARDVWGKGLKVTVGPAAGTPDAVVKRAQDVIDALFRDSDLNGTGPTWVRGLLEDGGVFVSPVVQGDRIIRMRPLPFLSIIPGVDTRGEFIDPTRAFTQIDLQSREEIAHFHLWQCNWIRYDWLPTRGDLHGRPQYLQSRGPGKALQMTENGLVITRLTRGPQRRQHKLGTPDTPSGPTEIQEYKRDNGLDNPSVDTITLDYVTNGKVEIKDLDGQPNLGEIDDVEHLQNTYMARHLKPKGLKGWGESINRDVLEQQQEEYQATLKGLRNLLWNGDGGVFSGIKAICDFALLLAGILPESVTYTPAWPLKLTKAQVEFVAEVAKLVTTGFISHKTGLSLVADTLGLESAEAELLLLEEERKAKQQTDDDDDRAFAESQTRSRNARNALRGDRGDDIEEEPDDTPAGERPLQ